MHTPPDRFAAATATRRPSKVEFDPSVNSCEALMQKFFAEAGAGAGGTTCRVPQSRVGRTTRALLGACDQEAAE